ncbi:leucine-rich repeat domain-containing protein, partial [Methanocalculus natronophilus]|uniref:leucine-rich repeat domain-containing protein n=1 Tax=Methanocalculus natronophilus TaxID=1262400 RepID=UPI0031B5A411
MINDMLEVIGKAAFMDTPLDTVTLHEDSMLQEIHPGAFKNTNIKEFFIPSDVQTLAYSEIIPSLGSNSVYHYGVFTGSDLETVTFAEDSTLTHIGPWTFANTNLESIDFPETIESIGDFAFKNTFVESIALPAYEMKILSLSENTFSH